MVDFGLISTTCDCGHNRNNFSSCGGLPVSDGGQAERNKMNENKKGFALRGQGLIELVVVAFIILLPVALFIIGTLKIIREGY